jgi:hypothetical protein
MAGAFIVIIVLACVAGLGYQKFRGIQALTFTHIDLTGLSLDEIAEIGGKTSRSLGDRLTGRTPAVRRSGSSAEWDVQVRHSVMAFSARPLPDGQGYRVGGAATKMRIAQANIGSDRGYWGLSKAMANGLYRTLGIPENSGSLVSLRKRVLRAIANAGTVIEPMPPQPADPAEPAGAAAPPFLGS